ncbi:MAG: HD-GYP domain-containing protein [Sulfuricella sp.]
MRQLVPADIDLGEPLRFSIFDEKGNLLLRQGIVITMPDQIDRLIARGAMRRARISDSIAGPTTSVRPPTFQEKEPPFERVGGLLLNYKHVVSTALKAPEQIDVSARVKKIALSLQENYQDDVDATLAACYLDYQNPYILVHQFMGAVLTEIIARRKGVESGERLSMVCAALTRDWGQIPWQSELERYEGPIPEPLKAKMREHPLQGVAMLSAAGVMEPIWLDSVRSHHERLDGSGYPSGLKGETIPLGARILAIADVYSAMAKPRSYQKKAHFPQDALREIYLKKDTEIDGELANILIREIGVFPAGSIVRLKCGEIAVIKSPASKAQGAQVFSIYGKTGMAMSIPIYRDTSSPEFEIVGLVPFSECRSASIMIKQVWLKDTT